MQGLITRPGNKVGKSAIPLFAKKLSHPFAPLRRQTAVLPLWSRLCASDKHVLPTVGECADHLSKFVTVYSQEVTFSGADGSCQCVLGGYDENALAITTWMVESRRTEDGMTHEVRQLQIPPGGIEVLGSASKWALEQLRAFKPAGAGWRREPLEMIRHQLTEDTQSDIGGGVQIGMITKEGFELCFDARPFTAGVSRIGDPLLAVKYRGFDFGDVSHVGSAFSSLRGIAS